MGKGRQRLASRGVRAQKQRARRRGVSFYRPFASVHLHTYHPDIWLEPGLFLFHPMTVIFPPKVYFMKAQHKGALTPSCIVRKNPQVPHTAQQVACHP